MGEDFVLADYNNAGKAMTRGGIVDLVGRRANDLYRDRPAILEDFSRCFDEKTSIRREMPYRLMTTGESKYWSVWYGFVPPDAILVHTEDITDRKQAEEALLGAKEDWENTFDAITDMVMLLDNKHRIVRANRAVAETLNNSKESLVGRKCYEAVHRKSRPIRRCPLVETMKTLKPHTVEIEEPDLGGTFICSTSPIVDNEGKVRVYTHSLKDITELKALEAQFQQAQKMEAIGTLASGIAHDFNNLLMGIEGRTSLMLMDMDYNHPYSAHLSGIEDAVKRGADLSKQLLGFARGGRYEVSPTDLNNLVEQSSEMFGRTRRR